ncbi:uncharacterized protein LOC142227557 [Haematobia irritans]|uniref:uncharacterized protein LOC142227557 n=1 Tax=Haematobia irritans TaxID=7368 RepID=UPI003F4F4D7C
MEIIKRMELEFRLHSNTSEHCLVLALLGSICFGSQCARFYTLRVIISDVIIHSIPTSLIAQWIELAAGVRTSGVRAQLMLKFSLCVRALYTQLSYKYTIYSNRHAHRQNNNKL